MRKILIISATIVSLGFAYWIITIKQAVDEKFATISEISGGKKNETKSPSGQPNTADRILFEKSKIDSLLVSNRRNIFVYSKVTDIQVPVKVINEQWPENIESTYNILKNDEGQVVYFAEFPTSESGDWMLKLAHYFNNEGKTIVFEKRLKFFNSECSEGVITEVVTDLFTDNFRLHATLKSLRDSDGNSLAQDHFKNCWDPYDWTLEKKGTAVELLNVKEIR